MKRLLHMIERVHSKLMDLFPPKFKTEFKEEMEIVFSEMVTAAAEKGKLALAVVSIQELCDLPILIIRTNLEEKTMIKTAHFQPAHFAFRGAISFGFGLACVKEFAVVFTLLFISILGNRLGWYHVLIASSGCIAASLIGGLLFAFLSGGRKQFGWYFLVGALGWFIPFSTLFVQNMFDSYVPSALTGLLPFLGFALDGACLSMALCVAKSQKRIYLLVLSIAAVLTPMVSYIIPKLFQDYSTLETSIVNVVMDVLLILGAILLAGKADQKNFWIVIVGTLSLPIVYTLCIVLPGSLYPHLPAGNNDPLGALSIIYWIIVWLPDGILFGLIISLIYGWQQRSALVEA
jgi:hypothetical protein